MKSRVLFLKNGLKLIFCQDNSKHMAIASLFVKFGGKYKKVEVDNNIHNINRGMAHFIEHLLIEHSKVGNCLLEFKKKHTFANGYTTKDHTEFIINSVVDFENDLISLINMVNNPVFNRDDVEETKKAIIKEKMMAEDNKFDYLLRLDYSCLFNYIEYPNILGEIEDINDIDYDKVKFCYDTFYQPSNQILIISGKFNSKKIKIIVEDTYDSIKRNKVSFKIPLYKELNNVVKKEGFIKKDVHMDFVRVNYKINVSSFTPKERLKLDFYMDYFLSYLFDAKSAVYNSLVEEKVCLYSINYFISDDGDFWTIKIGTYTNSHDEFVNKITSAISDKKVDIEDFNLRKKQALIGIILREDNLSNTITPFIDNVLRFGYDFMDTVEDIENHNFEEYKDFINKIDFSNYSITKMIRE